MYATGVGLNDIFLFFKIAHSRKEEKMRSTKQCAVSSLFKVEEDIDQSELQPKCAKRKTLAKWLVAEDQPPGWSKQYDGRIDIILTESGILNTRREFCRGIVLVTSTALMRAAKARAEAPIQGHWIELEQVDLNDPLAVRYALYQRVDRGFPVMQMFYSLPSLIGRRFFCVILDRQKTVQKFDKYS